MAEYNRSINPKDLPMPGGNKQRDYLLSAYKNVMLLLDYAWQDSDAADDRAREDLEACRQRLSDCANDLRQAYREGLPFVELSRCPISGEVLHHSLDIYGLDGLWWNNRNPIRPTEHSCRTMLAFTGAMKLDKDLEFANFLVKPGPGAAFVIPRLLSLEGVRAVVSSVMVGRHIGYVIAYFADPFPENVQRANDWGKENYQVLANDGRIGWDEADEIEDDYDFDLAPWIEQGKLRWIAPGDSELNLKSGIEDCPYIDLEGVREIQRVQEGELWYPSLIEKQGGMKEKGRA